MAQFTNTKRIDTINKITTDFKDRLKSPYQLNQDQVPFVVDYYNQSAENTTSDPASGLIYGKVGSESPIRLNKIEDALMYGLQQIQIDLDEGDYGIEAGDISGEAVILPNTWKPYPGDYFYIKHANNRNVFIVNGVTPDTMPNGANYYKIQFEYIAKPVAEIEALVEDSFRFIADNVGTNYSAVIRSSSYDEIEGLEAKLSALKAYYKELFYNDKVQTFVYKYNHENFYDAYMIEFLKRNNILNDNRDYTYISHAIPVSKTFAIEYDKTFLRSVELCDKDRKAYRTAVAKYIDNKLSLFYFNSSNFYSIEYTPTLYAEPIPILDDDIMMHISNNTYIQDGDTDQYRNIIIAYFNNSKITSIDLQAIDRIDYIDSMKLFYDIPVIIYILEDHIRKLIKKES